MAELSPDLCTKIEQVVGQLIAEAGCGPGSYLLVAKADAAPGHTLVQYDWWWRPDTAPPDIVDRLPR